MQRMVISSSGETRDCSCQLKNAMYWTDIFLSQVASHLVKVKFNTLVSTRRQDERKFCFAQTRTREDDIKKAIIKLLPTHFKIGLIYLQWYVKNGLSQCSFFPRGVVVVVEGSFTFL